MYWSGGLPETGEIMKKALLYLVLLLLMLPPQGCSNKSSGNNIKVVKPKYHHRWYSRKKDKHTKRIKSVNVKN
jgi:hypothetical protein